MATSEFNTTTPITQLPIKQHSNCYMFYQLEGINHKLRLATDVLNAGNPCLKESADYLASEALSQLEDLRDHYDKLWKQDSEELSEALKSKGVEPVMAMIEEGEQFSMQDGI